MVFNTPFLTVISTNKDPRFLLIPIAGWLADIRYGNFKVFKFGALLLFVSTVLTCIYLIMNMVRVHPTGGL